MRGLCCILLCLSTSTAWALDVCEIIANSKIVARDGKYLGLVASQYNSDSVLNEYGVHGSKYSADSIWNEYGQYSTNSPFNPYTSEPPLLIKDGKAIANLTVNKSLQAALNPYTLKTCEFY